MFVGNWDHTHRYLLDAERFIRRKGLTKLYKSRKVRLLHHSYTYLRLFHETTSLAHDSIDQCRQPSSSADETAEVDQDEPSFRLGAWNCGLEKKLSEVKDLEQGVNDLHLKNPSRWDYSLYHDVAGIPESFLNLLSQVVRLGNEIDISSRSPEPASLSWGQFSSSAKTLERCITYWKPSPQELVQQDEALEAHQLLNVIDGTLDNKMQALHHALTIYFLSQDLRY